MPGRRCLRSTRSIHGPLAPVLPTVDGRLIEHIQVRKNCIEHHAQLGALLRIVCEEGLVDRQGRKPVHQ